MHVYFLVFIYFIFIFYFFLCWAQLSPHRLGLTQPARPGHWAKPVTRLGPNQQEARMECLHACMHSAKVINYLRPVQCSSLKWSKENERKKNSLPWRREAETRWRTSGRCLLPPILFPSPPISDPLLSCSISLSFGSLLVVFSPWPPLFLWEETGKKLGSPLCSFIPVCSSLGVVSFFSFSI
jgi:hypothetical protein